MCLDVIMEEPIDGRTSVRQWLYYVGALIALAVGVTSFVLPIVIAGVALAAALGVLAARSRTKKPTSP